MPDLLRIKPISIQPHQAAVYEDFGKAFCRIATTDMNDTRISDPQPKTRKPASVSFFI